MKFKKFKLKESYDGEFDYEMNNNEMPESYRVQKHKYIENHIEKQSKLLSEKIN